MTNARSFSLFESSLKRGKKQQTTITINDSRPEESILNYALRGLKNGVRLIPFQSTWTKRLSPIVRKRGNTFRCLVLIVGGRRGALDNETGRSVTNSEYETARKHGIPCFVFVNRSVLTLLPIWKQNPNADFAPAVDYPEVFKFIQRIQEENRWIFPFDKTEEIETVFGVELSGMFRELLARHRAGTLDPIASYAHESLEAQRLAPEKPRFWEHLLTAELLNAVAR